MHRRVSTCGVCSAGWLTLAVLSLTSAPALAQDEATAATEPPVVDEASSAPAAAPAEAPVEETADSQPAEAEDAPPPAEASPDSPPTVVEREVRIELREQRAAPALDGVQLATVSLLAGVVSTVVAVPAALVAGSVLGSLPQNRILAIAPPLLVASLVPPLVVAGSEWLLQDWLVDDPGCFWIAWGSTTLVHLGALVGGGLLGVTATELPSLATLVAAESLLLPLTATTALTLTRAEDGHED